MKIAVVGAGVVGAATALVLAERGYDVLVLERAPEAAAGASHANGSGMTPWHAEPWNAPGTWRKLPEALLYRDRPWCVRPGAVPGMIGWGLQFLRHSRSSRYYRNARHCVRLALYSAGCLARLRDQHALEYRQVLRGSLELYFSPGSLSEAVELRRRLDLPGLDFQRLAHDELTALEPALEPVSDQVHGALYFPGHESGDACLFSRRALEKAVELGARVEFDRQVGRVVAEHGRLIGLEVDGSLVEADACILAAGSDSPQLLSPLGLKLPVYPVKGYSATIDLAPDDPAPTLPVLDLARRFVTARLGQGHLRIAGLAEFAGHDRNIDPRRVELLLNNAATLLPALRERILGSDPHAWTGLRPMTPDGPPLIGATPVRGLYLNTGHGAMGWTQAAGSAELIADLVTG
ncbi:MAG: FAD-dependent oxidoreductase, partial [Wenzhouxiangellaceae bacterium]